MGLNHPIRRKGINFILTEKMCDLDFLKIILLENIVGFFYDNLGDPKYYYWFFSENAFLETLEN